jgi:hypothetical protein
METLHSVSDICVEKAKLTQNKQKLRNNEAKGEETTKERKRNSFCLPVSYVRI